MYQVYCDEHLIYDPRIEDRKLLSAKCRLEANTVCDASLTMLQSHPHYGDLIPLRSVFEIRQDNHTLFRGRMTNNGRDFNKKLTVDLEGVLAYANDTIVPPFILEGGTITWGSESATCPEDEDVVHFFVAWILDRHNEWVEAWQQLKLGTVRINTPTDFSRSSEEYQSTWEVLESHLFGSTLGGYLYVRYEDDGNYVDYVAEFEGDNNQRLIIGTNILDINITSDADETYSAILPIGKDGVTLADIADEDITQDIVKEGVYVYSKKAVLEHGWICVPLADSKNDDIINADDLKKWAKDYLEGTAVKYLNTRVIKAVDLSFSDEQIAVIRPYRNTIVDAPAHDMEGVEYPLSKLEIDLLNPQNTNITLGDTTRSLVSINRRQTTGNQAQIEGIKKDVQKVNTDTAEMVKEQSIAQMTATIAQCNQIILSALESYVETSNFEQYQETVSTQLQILSDEILMSFSTVTDRITTVDGEVQSKFDQVYKYIQFADGSITLGSSENNITLSIENDIILFRKNGVQFGWWDGVDFHTGNIVVEVNERAQFGNFAFVPRSDGSLMFLKVGG